MSRRNLSFTSPPSSLKLNRGHPLANGLVACWPLNDGAGGVAKDLAGNQYGTFTGLTDSVWYPGPYGGKAIRFTGNTANYVDISFTSRMPTAFPFSVMAVCDPSSFTTAGSHCIFCYSNTALVQSYIYLGLRSTVGLLKSFFWCRSSLDSTIANGSIDLTSMKRVSIVGVAAKSGSGHKTFVNGILNLTDGNLHKLDTGFNKCSIGRLFKNNTTSDICNGTVSTVMVWDRALTDTEASDISSDPYMIFDYPRQQFTFGTGISGTVNINRIERKTPRGVLRGVYRGN